MQNKIKTLAIYGTLLLILMVLWHKPTRSEAESSLQLQEEVMYVSSHADGSVGGLAVADEDIFIYDETIEATTVGTTPWAMHVDGSQLASLGDVNAFLVLSDTSILMSFESPVTLPEIGGVTAQDIVRFVPTETGITTTGQFEWYFDGSDVDLDVVGENIDAFTLAPDGRLLISTSSLGSVTGIPSFTYEDIIAFTPAQLGEGTGGTWEMYFDGSDVALAGPNENIVGLWLDEATGNLYLSTSGAFAVDGLSGTGEDIFVCVPGALGEVTGCAEFNMFFDGSKEGLTNSVDGFTPFGNLEEPRFYLSTYNDITVGQVTFADEDIIGRNMQTGRWEMYFDGSDMGTTVDLDAFFVLTDSILMSFEATVTLPDVGSVLEQDIVRFVPSSTGEITAGQFEWYFDGSDVEFDHTNEDIDAIAFAPDGRLLISPISSSAVTGIASFAGEDLLAFTPTQLGETTSGTWELYFDGSDIALAGTNENIVGAWVDSATEDVYLSAWGAFATAGDFTGEGMDVFICDPFEMGITTLCHFEMFWDGSVQGFPASHSVDGFALAPHLNIPPPSPSEPELIYVSSHADGSVGGISTADEDIVVYNGNIDHWDIHFDGSDLGIGTADINAMLVLSDSSLLLSFETEVTLSDLGVVTRQDIVRFMPASTGTSTRGHFEWYFNGSDVELEQANTLENIDAIALAPDGRLIISTVGLGTVTGVPSFGGEDLLAFTPISLGHETTGSWEMYFDGSDVNLSGTAENIVDIWIDHSQDPALPKIYLTTEGAFSVLNLSGDAMDIFVCTPFLLGNHTNCLFDPFFDGSAQGLLPSQNVDGFSLEFNEEVPTIYLSTAADTTVSRINYANEDILSYDTRTGRWEMFFDGSDVQVTGDVEAFLVESDSILMSFDATVILPDVMSVTPSDIVRFIPTSTGTTTAGQFEWYFDGEDVDLTTTSEYITAIGMAPDGRLLISTNGNGAVTGVPSFVYHDLLAFTPTLLGQTTIGTWEMYLDGSDVALTTSYENIWGVWADAGQVYLSTYTTFAVPGLGGDGTDIFGCMFGALGEVTTCSTFTMLLDGSTQGLTQVIDGFSIATAAPCHTVTTLSSPPEAGTVNQTSSAPCASGEHEEGTTVTLTANPNPGYTFTHWTGHVTGSANPTTITMNNNKLVTAHFMTNTLAISELRTTNVRDVSFTVSWLTNAETTSEIRYGTDPNNLNQSAFDDRGAATSDDTHHVTINGLNASTTYYFDVVSGPLIDNNLGQHYSLTTGPTLGVPSSDARFAQVFQADGTTPAEGSLLYLTIENGNAGGTPGRSTPLSAVVDDQGYWSVNLGNARKDTLNKYFTYSNGDYLVISAFGAADGTACAVLQVRDNLPTLVLGDEENFPCPVSWPISLQSSWNHISFPLAPMLPYSAEGVCDEIESEGGSLTELDRWYQGGWDGHMCGLTFNDYTLEVGSGYFIRSDSAITWTFQGLPIRNAVPLDLIQGWNSIGIPHTNNYVAETLCDDIINQGVTALEIDRWHNGGWDSHICGFSFNNFPIEIGTGYFVQTSSSGTVTPSAPASLTPLTPRRGGEKTPPLPGGEGWGEGSGPFMAVRNLQVSNLRDTSVTLSWSTDDITTGYVLYGESADLGQVAYDVRGASMGNKTHYVTLSNLKPQTTYHIQIVSGAQVDQKSTQTITTTAQYASLPESDSIYGQIFKGDGKTPARGAIVYLTLQDDDGNGSEADAMLLSALVDAQGYWHANLGNARQHDSQAPFAYSAQGDLIKVHVDGGSLSTTQTLDASQLQPAPPLRLLHQLHLPIITR